LSKNRIRIYDVIWQRQSGDSIFQGKTDQLLLCEDVVEMVVVGSREHVLWGHGVDHGQREMEG